MKNAQGRDDLRNILLLHDTRAPGTTRSMRTAVKNLVLEHLWAAYPGKKEYDLDEIISVIPVSGIL
jgi:hypothetical protein